MSIQEMRAKYRREIQENGAWLYDQVPEVMQDLVGEIMALNVEWAINHPDATGTEKILKNGFMTNQIIFIKRVAEAIE